eukprot:m.27301 g.27301  ORF g.27301 m.27301 type:complete len:772 (+) comp8513_c0_seq1:208-2523(+)
MMASGEGGRSGRSGSVRADVAATEDGGPGEQLDNLDEIRQRLQRLREEEHKQDADLRSALSHAGDMEVKIASLQSLQPKLAKLFLTAKDLSEMVGSTCALAENVSSKVRELDMAKGRLQSTIQRVDDLIDLRTCVDGAQAALNQDKFEEAAGHIHRYLNFDQEFLAAAVHNGGAAGSDVADGDGLSVSAETLEAAKRDLEQRIEQRFEAAAASNNAAEVLRYVKLYPLLHLHHQGMHSLCRFLRQRIQHDHDARFRKDEGQRQYVKLLMSLLEQVAKVVEEQEPVVETHFGAGYMPELVKALLQECDVRGGQILDEFLRVRQCDQLLKGTSPRVQSAGGDETPGVDLKMLDGLLGELTQCMSITAMFFRFLSRKMDADQQRVTEAGAVQSGGPPAPKPEFLTTLLRASTFNRQLQELAGQYIALEQHFLVASVRKAIAMQTRQTDGTPVTTVVDDVFFLLQKCCHRAVSSYNPDCVCAMINHVSSTLLTEYLPAIQARAEKGYPTTDLAGVLQSKLQSIGSRNESSSDTATEYLVVMNDTEVSYEYTSKLKNDLSSGIQQKFQHSPAKDKSKLESCVSDLSATANTFQQTLMGFMNELCGKALRSQLRGFVDALPTNSFELSEDDVTGFDGQSPFMASLVTGVQGILRNFKPLLLSNGYNRLVAGLVDQLVVLLEQALGHVSFNRLGGLQFDRDLRSLVTSVSEATQWPVRDKFARLSQVSTLLNLESVAELADYWGPTSGVTWRLSPSEVRKVLSLRTDFSRPDIDKLRL